MASNPPESGRYAQDDAPDPGQRWIGRARVTAPSGPAVARATAPPPVTYGYPPSAPAPVQRPRTRGLRPRWGRIALVVLTALALLAGSGILVGYLWFKGVNDDLKRQDPFAQLEGRPPKVADGTINILLLGSDARHPDYASDGVSGERADSVVILHIPASHDRAYMVAIPRDTWVEIPESADGQEGGYEGKINGALNGGLSLMVQTVEEYTKVRMDHVALIDFAGLVQVTDAVGGVDMTVAETIDSIHPPYRKFEAGTRHFNGEEALDYIRQRYQFADGDFTRIQNQQMYLKALLDKAVSVGTVTNIGNLRAFVTSVANAITVDRDFSLIDLAWQFRSLRSENLTFVVTPNLGTGTIGDQSVVVSDDENRSSFYEAMANDTFGEWLTQHGQGNEAGAGTGN
jgi:LCP family protein required for cell wall assembly